MQFDAKTPDASDGKHMLIIRPLGSRASTLEGSSFHSTERLSFWNSYWVNSDVGQPPESTAQGQAVRSMLATSDSPLEFEYKNLLDVEQPNHRSIKLVVEEATY
ncbi:hypothetical protein [Haloferax sulfurifontis]|nr:hypothetical protein [Haloferax sulfurifontis]